MHIFDRSPGAKRINRSSGNAEEISNVEIAILIILSLCFVGVITYMVYNFFSRKKRVETEIR